MNTFFSVWVDADSCPVTARNFILDYTIKNKVSVYFVANHAIPGPLTNVFFSMIICGRTEGSADDYIYNNCTGEDIVVTRDIPLAARLIEKHIIALNDRGSMFSLDTIEKRLAERNYNLTFSALGLNNCGRNSYGKKEFAAFTASFDREMQRKLSQRQKNAQQSESSEIFS
jgi:uncharacterized protein